MQNWDELRTAYYVAKMGTVSGAAEVLGVHHATVIRHIDALETALDVRLFQRHARGYTPTEAGMDLMQVAARLEEQVQQMANRLQGNERDLSGELIVTYLSEISHLVMPQLAAFRLAYPSIRVVAHVSERLYRLETGEAHVALRAGSKTPHPDSVVQNLGKMRFSLYAHHDYLEAKGIDKLNGTTYQMLEFIVNHARTARAPHHAWIEQNIAPDQISMMFSDERMILDAVRSGAGAAFLSDPVARLFPELARIHTPCDLAEPQLQLVTHVDLHRTPKVQAMTEFLKAKLSPVFHQAGGNALSSAASNGAAALQ